MIKTVFTQSFVRRKSRRFRIGTCGCYLCWINFSSVADLNTHLIQHFEGVRIKNINASWKSIGKVERVIFNVHSAGSLIFALKNKTDGNVIVKEVCVYNEASLIGRLNPGTLFPHELKPGTEITIRLLGPWYGLSMQNHFVIIYEESCEEFCEKIQSYQVELKLDMLRVNYLEQHTLPEMGGSQTIYIPMAIQNPLQAQRIKNVLKLIHELPMYEPTTELKNLFWNSFQPHPSLNHYDYVLLDKINQYNGELTPFNYCEMLSTMLQIEYYTARVDICGNTKTNRTLIQRGYNEFTVTLSECEGRPLFLIKGDSIWVGRDDNPNFRISGYVKHVSSKEIVMKLHVFNTPLEPSSSYSIHFEVNRLTYQMERDALNRACRNQIIDYLFPRMEFERDHKPLPELRYFDRMVKSDVAQMNAVQHIVAGSAYPLPYLLIGYPGTGKTKVIVESICQLFSYPTNRILVCASSNSVCDEIAQKLITLMKGMQLHQTPVTEQYNLLRLYAASVRRPCKGDEIMENSNFDEKSIPCLAEIYQYRIVVCTLTVAGRLAQGGISSEHFTHLFIDECESAAETYTLIPIVGVCSSLGKINARIVMCGDPKQLGPIVRSKICRDMNFNVSMFQRLCLSEPYQKDSHKNYNPRLISKLKNNYRSHRLLVNMPNRLFYNTEMKTSTNESKIKWLCEFDFLPVPGFPILFENIEGIPETKDKCLSWFNTAETESVIYYVRTLLNNKPKKIKQSDIGIISPYKRQCIHLEEALEEIGLTEIEVGSVEQYQGKEKPIIILSTVRNGQVGFLNQRERINVMITRAIGLLIIIGHKKSLCENNVWRKIIDYTTKNCNGEMILRCEQGADERDDERC